MNASRIRLVLAVLVTTLFTLGCGRDGTGVEPGDNAGTLTFNFVDGQTSGSFTATGEVQMSPSMEPQFGTWAAAGRPVATDLLVGAFRVRTTPRGDVAIVYVPDITGPRSVTINEACFDTEADCPFMYLVVNASFDDVEIFDRICLLLSGTITVDALSSQRARGTFSGTGACATSDSTSPQLFSVNNGTFDVPIVPGFTFE